MSDSEKIIFLAVPNRGSIATGTATALFQCGKTRVHRVHFHSTSILTQTFNSLWATALNERKQFTHFVMLHDDVAPMDADWLDALCEEYDRTKCDVLSAVVPIKDERGLTSTAFWNPATRDMVRVTMTEAMALPKSFAGGAYKPGWVVLPNTGLWICDFRKPWVEKICFTMRDRVFFDAPSQTWLSQCYSEDWDFGVQCHYLNAEVMATMAVKLQHHGEFKFPNMVAWGTLNKDDQINNWLPPSRTYGGKQ